MSGISFKIKSSKETQVISQSDESVNEKEIVFSLEGNKIKSTKPEEVKQPLAIPLIKNQWNPRVKETIKTEIKDQESGELTLDQLAAKEILEECTPKNENDEIKESTQVIPLNSQNKSILGFEGDEKLDLSKHPDEPTQENYDEVPVSEFGLAMIRGMGWKPDEGIGLTNKKCVKPHELKSRPHGIGLGFNISLNPQGKTHSKTKTEGEELKLIKGSYVYILEGRHKGLYGQVESFDEDTNAIVKLTLTNKTIHISEVLIKVVSQSEYKKESKILNKSSYEEYKSKQDKDNKKHVKPENPFENYKETESGHKHKRKKAEKEEETRYSRAAPNWVQPQLKVRFIDPEYKKGRYYKAKLVVEDVVTLESCICRTESGQVLDEVSTRMLETVIPRGEAGLVMVVQGRHRRELGSIVHRDKDTCRATVQLHSSKKVYEFDYDSICEYVGPQMF
ncbi:GPKOW [Cordylochernes scorpioides]|uniref:GPKOW n=1 Tax=Cordylochernes scorpioides TaxID=51811 RepID=A0ABY6K203_9ARAC|nr:GPKOW [Cordylochernes scorpioides]